MDIGKSIKTIRKAKGLTQKEVVMAAGLDTGQYSRIENGKTDPSISTLEKIAKAIGVGLAEFFTNNENDLKEVKSYDKTLMEKITLIDGLDEKEKQTIYTMLDTFVSKNKLKNALSSALDNL